MIIGSYTPHLIPSSFPSPSPHPPIMPHPLSSQPFQQAPIHSSTPNLFHRVSPNHLLSICLSVHPAPIAHQHRRTTCQSVHTYPHLHLHRMDLVCRLSSLISSLSSLLVSRRSSFIVLHTPDLDPNPRFVLVSGHYWSLVRNLRPRSMPHLVGVCCAVCVFTLSLGCEFEFQVQTFMFALCLPCTLSCLFPTFGTDVSGFCLSKRFVCCVFKVHDSVRSAEVIGDCESSARCFGRPWGVPCQGSCCSSTFQFLMLSERETHGVGAYVKIVAP
ncbi:hypothetical protein C8Q74DRAFT_306711 [Fomes fomentarius]|nr:hypothetical protein C8Q74DRAFT_306711 [Fomes fomentarius]